MRSGVPRTRGDGPCASTVGSVVPGGSPHTRGWTLCRRTSPSSTRGFPAHAGMDPSRRRSSPVRLRVPRTRGDGPAASNASIPRSTGSPHTRGWTPALGHDPAQEFGFPAHAGMDRLRGARPTSDHRVPRTRGDGPRAAEVVWGAARGSPHTRGWTDLAVWTSGCSRGFPAHAGMDPGRDARRDWLRRVPRTRGDGPHSSSSSTEGAAGSPHTRGWTPRDDPLAGQSGGFPAHAGMDRSGASSWTGITRVPRTRGDGPAASCRRASASRGSPHTRGWTQLPCSQWVAAVGFPAHAGMDPSAPFRAPC